MLLLADPLLAFYNDLQYTSRGRSVKSEIEATMYPGEELGTRLDSHPLFCLRNIAQILIRVSVFHDVWHRGTQATMDDATHWRILVCEERDTVPRGGECGTQAHHRHFLTWDFLAEAGKGVGVWMVGASATPHALGSGRGV